MPKKIVIPAGELYDEGKNLFYQIKEQTIFIEHSLISISKWEEIHKKPYLDDTPKTVEEYLDYVRCMTLTQNVPYEAYYNLSKKQLKDIQEYENEIRSATTITNHKPQTRRMSNEKYTSELLYYYMLEAGIPFDPCQKWHLSRLIKLIEVIGAKRNPKKMSKGDTIRSYRELNELRKKKYHTKG